MKKYDQRFRGFVGANPITRALGLILAGIGRRLLFLTTFIVVSGSVGKTTAKNAIALVLGAHFPTYKTTGSFDHYIGINRNLLAVRPWHREVKCRLLRCKKKISCDVCPELQSKSNN